MSNLAQETQAARQLIEQIRADYPDDEDLLHDMVEGETDLFRIMDWIANKIGEDDAAINAIKRYQDELGQRAGRLAKRIDSNRARLAGTLDVLGMKKLELPTATLSMRNNKPSMVIDDQGMIPDTYFESVPKLDRAFLRKDLEAGAEIPGAHMSNAEPSLTIRRK